MTERTNLDATGPVAVPRHVFECLDAIRRSGLTNMFNATGVAELARARGRPEVAD